MLRKGIYVFTFLANWMSKNVEMHQMAEEINGQSISLYQKLCCHRGHTFVQLSSSEFFQDFQPPFQDFPTFSFFLEIPAKRFSGSQAGVRILFALVSYQFRYSLIERRSCVHCIALVVLVSYIPVAAEALWYTFHMALHCTVVTASELHCAALCIW